MYTPRKVVKKILERYPDQIEAKETRVFGFRTPIGEALNINQHKTAEILLDKGAKNVIWN